MKTDLSSQNNINKTVLPNGLTVVTEAISSYRSVSIGVWIKTGSRYEDYNNMGIVHFIEHMLFKGTKSRSAMEIASSIEDLGGSINAFTGKEETCFYIHILDTHVKEGIEILGDMICNSVIKDNDISMEKQVVLEEIKATKDTPDEYVFDLFQEKVFPDTPMGYHILGNEKSVNNITENQINSYIEKHYNAQNIVVSAAGNINHEEFIEVVINNFKLKRKVDEKNIIKTKPQSGINFIKNESLNQAHLCLGMEGSAFTSKDRFNLIALNSYLGSGLSSKLFQILREELGLVYSIYSFLDFYIDTGIIGFYMGTDKNNIEKAIDSLKNELTKLNEDHLSFKSISNLREQIKGSFLLSLESTFKRMTRLAKNEIYYNRFINSDELISEIDKITAESVCNTAKKYLNTSKLNSVILSPVKLNA